MNLRPLVEKPDLSSTAQTPPRAVEIDFHCIVASSSNFLPRELGISPKPTTVKKGALLHATVAGVRAVEAFFVPLNLSQCAARAAQSAKSLSEFYLKGFAGSL
jgi:hypothetical protein